MPFLITRYEETPNPNALKCWLDHSISDRPRSFLSAEMAAADPIARALFAAGLTSVYFNREWMTINKPPDATWPAIKQRVTSALAAAEPA
jgi:hypothetical protein